MKRSLYILCLFALLLLAACRPKPAPQPPPPPAAENAIGLFPDDDGGVGRIQFSNSAGSVELSQPNTLVIVTAADLAPGQPITVDPAEMARRFGGALDGLPVAQAEFVLYFQLGGDQLTAESEAVLPALLQAVTDRKSTDVSIIGHTDRTGTVQANYELGLRRAERVAQILTTRGLSRDSITLESHGEGNLLVQTADGVEEPRNRRVEVTVR